MPELNTVKDLERLMSLGTFSSTGASSLQEQSLGPIINSKILDPEQVIKLDIGGGAKLIIVRNDTILSDGGQYLGGVRLKYYPNEDAAINDGKPLGRGMTHKWAILNYMMSVLAQYDNATLPEVQTSLMGGGKAVLYFPNFNPRDFSRQGTDLNDFEKRLLREQIAPALKEIKHYIFAPDVGTDTRWVDYVSQFAPDNAACLSTLSGDPSVVTAKGTYIGMMRAVEHRLGQNGLDGLVIAVQGLGKVGSHLIRYIVESHRPAEFIISDPKAELVESARTYLEGQNVKVKVTSPEQIYSERFDILSPNAVGQILTPKNINIMLGSNPDGFIIAGAANNQLDERTAGSREEAELIFHRHNILYAPDFAINLGGIENLMYEFPSARAQFGNQFDPKIPLDRINGVRNLMDTIFVNSQKFGIPTQLVAEYLAEAQLARYALFKNLTAENLKSRSYIQRA